MVSEADFVSSNILSVIESIISIFLKKYLSKMMLFIKENNIFVNNRRILTIDYGITAVYHIDYKKLVNGFAN